MKYQYVSLKNEYMRVAYERAKQFYSYKKWNLKTTPIAVIVKDKKIISISACADGAHPIFGKCDRLSKSGTSYDKCKYCKYDQHAEHLALKKISKNFDLTKAEIYLYGHHHICNECGEKLQNRGINKCYLLNNCKILFDRHNPKTVLGTNKQFII